MSVSVTTEEHDELEKLDDQTKAAAMRRLEKSGDALGELTEEKRKDFMRAAIEAAAEEVKEQIDNADRAALELLAPDGAFRLGARVIRPIGLGTLAILQRIDHPIMSGQDMAFDDLCSLLYVVASEDLLSVVQASFQGGDALKCAATLWGMDIDAQEMRVLEAALQPMLDAAMNWGAAEDGTDDDPTKPVRNG